MAWQGLFGHDEVVAQFRHALTHDRLASTFLFVGPPGVGKSSFARRLAQALLCETNPATALDPCGHCPACQQVQADSHPDLEVIRRPEGKSVIPIELFIGDDEHRMREGLCYRIAMKPFRGGRKVAIINDADYLNQEGANCLLKTLEEPPPRSVLMLIGTSEQKQLPTIRSRCQIIRFRPLSADLLADLLLKAGHVETLQQGLEVAREADGSMSRALHWLQDDWNEFRQALVARLAQPDWNAQQLGREITEFAGQAGKDSAAKRNRLRHAIQLTGDFYRQLMRSLGGAECTGDGQLENAVQQAHGKWSQDVEAAAACVDRCLLAETELDRNANQATLVDCWLDDLDRLAR